MGGGPCAMNPEPLADVFDCFCLGDGEETVLDLMRVLKAKRGKPRAEKLAALSKLPGVYVPQYYRAEHGAELRT